MSVIEPRIVQMSDLHIFADKEKSLLGVETHKSLSAVIDLIKTDPVSPDIILLTGDLSQDNSEKSYLNIIDLFQELPAPVYCLPGNHDDIDIMTRFFPQRNISDLKNIVLDHWQIILLNSQKTGAVEGFLDELQLEFMQECLKKYPMHHAIIAFHHQPIMVGSAWLDNLGLKNADVFWDILKSFPQVKTILFGHVHQAFTGQKNGINIYSTPSTCIQFKPNVADFALDPLPPAYRWMDLKSNGELETGIIRCANYIGQFDENAKGY
ncbi:MAG: 3',5'-cyclic-AMP phosphodiesterase [Gammaproteobacteria bacterium]|nr:3',5'-cyclic-AMP phosphodiesterase [Gammaproteobacteria bacterium]